MIARTVAERALLEELNAALRIESKQQGKEFRLANSFIVKMFLNYLRASLSSTASSEAERVGICSSFRSFGGQFNFFECSREELVASVAIKCELSRYCAERMLQALDALLDTEFKKRGEAVFEGIGTFTMNDEGSMLTLHHSLVAEKKKGIS